MNAALTDVSLLAASKPLDRNILIREAKCADNEALLALARVTPMDGRFALRMDRDPDFFALLRRRGEPIVFVATCESRVIGSVSAAIHPTYVNGVLEEVAHVGDLKVPPLFTGKRLSSRLISALDSHLKRADVKALSSPQAIH